MKAGRLRHRITIQKATEAQDSTGQAVKTWSTFTRCWSEIVPLSGRELQAAQAISAEASHSIRIRHVDGITPKHRIAYGSRVFDINGITDTNERGRELILTCRERV